MIPVTGLDAGAGKAGLIQSSATCSDGLECRKVLLIHGVTTIPAPTCTLIPESQTACEFAGGALDSIATHGSIWEFWGRWEIMDFIATCTGFGHHDCFRLKSDILHRDEPFRSETAAQSIEPE
jgi:hypothetical protein